MMNKHTESPRPTWQKVGLIATFLLIVMASSAALALADNEDKNPGEFGLGADVEVEVERAEDPPTHMDNNPEEFGVGAEVDVEVERGGLQPTATIWIVFISLILIVIVALLMRKFKMRGSTATIATTMVRYYGGEMLG